jgi:hypothetical protein
MRNHVATWIFVLAVSAPAAFAQEPPTPPAQPPPPTTPSSTTPAPIRAQKPQAAKRVWTNDDLGELTGVVTTASSTPSGGAADAQANAAPDDRAKKDLPPEKDPEVYRKKLEPLRAQLAQTESKIKEMQDAIDHPIDGKNAINLNQQAPNLPKADQPADYQEKRPDNAIFGNQVVRPEDQLVVYRQRRDALRQQIDDLEAEARKNGIDPGDIRGQ